MASSITLAVIIFVGMKQLVSAGNQCSVMFPGTGECILNNFACPTGSSEFTKLSNGIGCPTLNSRCCIRGGLPTDPTTTDRSSCGVGSLPLASRILNGMNAGPCDWPFVVSIRAKLKTSITLDYGSTAHSCAGVLIDKYWVLTSAICILNSGQTVQDAPNRFIVVAGEYNISGADTDPRTGGIQEQMIRVKQAIIHPDYAFRSADTVDQLNPVLINSHGIGLIQLAEPIVGRCSGLICLPTFEEANDTCANYENCVITGWGFATESYSPPQGSLDILKQGFVRLTSKKGCDIVVKKLGKETTRPAGTNCQVPARGLTDGCLGDEGGAVMCSTGSNWVVRGILPYQVCLDTKFSLFITDVSYYLTWIKNTMSFYTQG